MRTATLSLIALLLGSAAHAQTVTTLVPGSAFHGVHGIRFAPNGELYAGSVVGQSLYAVNVETGAVRTVEGPPHGMADDIAFGPGEQVVWTAISENTVYTRRGAGPVEVLVKDMPGANSVAFSRDGKRLFLGQVFAGDAVWELDPAGVKPPRKIAGPVGGFNSFTVGPDGALYGPLWFKGQIARIDPDSGAVTVVAEGLQTPAAAKFNAKDELFAIDTKTGEVLRIDLKTGAKTRVAQLKTSLDNMEFAKDGRLFVSNMADNGVQEVNVATGAVRQVVKGALAFPADIDVRSSGGKDTLYVADVFAYRSVDGATGAVTDIARVHADPLEYPTGISVGAEHVILTSAVAGTLETFNRADGRRIGQLHGFQGPSDALELPHGALLVAEAPGDMILVEGASRRTLASGLKAPTSIARAADGTIYVVEAGANRLVRLDLTTGAVTPVASGFNRPKAVAVGRNGRPVVLDLGERAVIEINPKTGAKTVIARDLPLGLLGGPSPLGGGIAVGAGGDIYVASEVENAIYRIRR